MTKTKLIMMIEFARSLDLLSDKENSFATLMLGQLRNDFPSIPGNIERITVYAADAIAKKISSVTPFSKEKALPLDTICEMIGGTVLWLAGEYNMLAFFEEYRETYRFKPTRRVNDIVWYQIPDESTEKILSLMEYIKNLLPIGKERAIYSTSIWNFVEDHEHVCASPMVLLQTLMEYHERFDIKLTNLDGGFMGWYVEQEKDNKNNET